jgi:hypothetical protein
LAQSKARRTVVPMATVKANGFGISPFALVTFIWGSK